ncbi:hypothetical protein H5085_06370 [Pseudoalteromonas sp. SR43-6]|uniref:hypothetical protein n=1 Tax=unclassified Pseudoalteromonas TaxID=194690 RepID=UPI0015FDFF01|nr:MULTISPECIES: hypothetical protein [unclassified Pseudoalteromonas]MBB1288531.1 hypothetical protein [Pseudoalteromonas sp. SR41-5]MBB1373941.1 hypothetical protein [Pseudoalteromonas sp. SR43-6]MBB1412992.1 hypothetical protein [Pseudoalteromonas sp. SG43-8]
MLVNYLIKAPNENVDALSRQMDTRSELKRQHHAAFQYRLKRFAVTKVGLSSAFIAGAAVQAGKSETSFVRKYGWLVNLIA